jgi:prenylcysteine oxidase/farnesylcysteine lyase
METETVASRNVVDLLLNEEFSSGICGITSPTPGEELFSGTLQVGVGEDPVFGWDC